MRLASTSVISTRRCACADTMLAQFFDPAAGGFFYTAADGEQLIARQKDWQDSSTPSGNAMAATALLRLGKLTGRGDYLDAAVRHVASGGRFDRAIPLGGRPDARGPGFSSRPDAGDRDRGPVRRCRCVGRAVGACAGGTFRTRSSPGGCRRRRASLRRRSNQCLPVKSPPPNRPSISARTSPAKRQSSANPRRWTPSQN